MSAELPPTVVAVVPAAGRGERLGGGQPKALREIGGTTMLEHAVASLLAAPSVGLVVVAAPPADVERIQGLLGGGCSVVAGGSTRSHSVRLALAALPAGGSLDVVLVHDAARPFVPVSVIEAVVAAVRGGHDAVVPVVPLPDTVKRVAPDGRIQETVPRGDLYGAQTPQGFRPAVLRAAHAHDQPDATDDAVLIERQGTAVWTVPGSELAFKVTTPVDLERAQALLAGRRT